MTAEQDGPTLTDEQHEQKVRSRRYSGPTIPETGALLRLLDAERAKVARMGEAITDTCWKATQYGETADGDTLAYIIPKGTVHRLIGAAQSSGIPAVFRA